MPVIDYTPDIAEVAFEVRARLTDGFGNEDTTFNEDTRPDANQAQAFIENAADEVSAQIGLDIPERTWVMAARAVALRAAAMIERTYWPEQAGDSNNRSTYNVLMAEYKDLMKILATAVTQEATTDGSGGIGQSDMPSYNFPYCGGIDLDTRF